MIWHLANLTCPSCAAVFNAAGSMKDDEEIGPTPGDVAVCAECYTKIRYFAATEDALGLEELPEEAWQALPEQNQAALMQAEALAKRHQLIAHFEHEYKALLRRASANRLEIYHGEIIQIGNTTLHVVCNLKEDGFAGVHEEGT